MDINWENLTINICRGIVSGRIGEVKNEYREADTPHRFIVGRVSSGLEKRNRVRSRRGLGFCLSIYGRQESVFFHSDSPEDPRCGRKGRPGTSVKRRADQNPPALLSIMA